MLEELRMRIAQISLARQFIFASFFILVSGMLLIGWWVGEQIARGVINQTAGVTALYVDSFIAPYLQDLERGAQLDSARRQRFDELMTTTSLGQRIVAFKVWSRSGEILYYSTAPTLIGQTFPKGIGLQRALAGQVAAHLSDLKDDENAEERKRWSRLLETYAPVRLAGTDRVIAVSEFYQTPDALEQEIAAAQRTSWLIVSVCTVAMYLLLAGIVGRGSQTIAKQQRDLEEKIRELGELVAENSRLHERMRGSAARTVAINERFLRRIGADLHDGPGQDVGFALLRLDALADHCAQCPIYEMQTPVREELAALQIALQSGLRDLRAIAAGLRLPELDALSPAQTVARAVEEHARKTKARVEFRADGAPASAALPVKITLYRLAQEALANAQRHTQGAEQKVRLGMEGAEICLEVSDDGAGFDPQTIRAENGQLGLTGMRERVQALGGTFTVESGGGTGTRVRARLPKEVADE